MNKLIIFDSLKTHAWFGRLFKKLNKSEIQMITDFLKLNSNLNKNDFEFELNRMFLNKNKPKNWLIIQELLSATNS